MLLVEDEPRLRSPIEQFLRMRHFDVASAETAQQGIALLNACRPVAAIVDLHLKEGSGRDVVVRVPAPVPVIIFSGMRAESAQLERLRPRTRMIEKPYSLTMLLEQLEDMLARSRDRAS